MNIETFDDTKTRIVKSTIKLFNQYGPMVPMSKISESAGVATGTPYKHYKTKEALLLDAYRYARNTVFQVEMGDPLSQPTTEGLIKTIIRHIIRWAALMPAEHEYVEKYEDAVCYNYFSKEFDVLYEGIVEELGIWERIKADVRQDLPQKVISRIVSVQCSVFIRYMSYHKMQLNTPEMDAFLAASADSIWRSIARVSQL